jgi:hypothetical protein
MVSPCFEGAIRFIWKFGIAATRPVKLRLADSPFDWPETSLRRGDETAGLLQLREAAEF